MAKSYTIEVGGRSRTISLGGSAEWRRRQIAKVRNELEQIQRDEAEQHLAERKKDRPDDRGSGKFVKDPATGKAKFVTTREGTRPTSAKEKAARLEQTRFGSGYSSQKERDERTDLSQGSRERILKDSREERQREARLNREKEVIIRRQTQKQEVQKRTPTSEVSRSKIDVVEEPKEFLPRAEFKLKQFGARVLQKRQDITVAKSPSRLEAKEIGKAVGFTAAGVGVGFAKGAVRTGMFAKSLVTRPVETGKQVFLGVKDIVTKPGETFTKVSRAVTTKPEQVLGGAIFEVALSKGLGKATGVAAKSIKSKVIKTGATRVAPEKVFSSEVLAGKKTLPTVRTKAEALGKFKKTDLVVTASPERIKGTVAGVGKKAALGLEDPGIFVTPLGEGSPYFTRIQAIAPETKFTLLPFKGAFKTPTATIFKTKGIAELPRKVISQPGFKPVQTFQKRAAGSGKVFLTKRSEIGLGAVKPQKFKTPAGRIVTEAGTSELEAVIPVSQKFITTPGKRKFTEFLGQPVRIREAELVVNVPRLKGAAPSIVSQKVLTGKQLLKESSTLSSSVLRPVRYVSPYPSVLAFSSVVYPSSVPSSVVSRPVRSSVKSSISRPQSSVIRGVPSRVSSRPSRVSSPSRSPLGRSGSSTIRGSSIIRRGGGSILRRPTPDGTISPVPTPQQLRPLLFDEEKPEKKKKRLAPQIKQPFKYSPTLFSVVGGIKATKKIKLGRIGFTGLENRPILPMMKPFRLTNVKRRKGAIQ
jgi:hypothetical protein